MEEPLEGPYLKSIEVARLYHVRTQTVRMWIKTGKIPKNGWFKLEHCYYIYTKALKNKMIRDTAEAKPWSLDDYD